MARPVCHKRGSPNGLASPRAHRPDVEHTNPQVTAGGSDRPTPHGGILAVHGGEEVNGVLWRDFFDRDSILGGFVLGVLLETAERPLLELRGVRDAFADVFQFLERDVCTVVSEGFLYQSLRDTVQVVFAPVGEASAE